MIPKTIINYSFGSFFVGQPCLAKLACRRSYSYDCSYLNKDGKLSNLDFFKVEVNDYLTHWYFEEATLKEKKNGVDDVVERTLWVISLDKDSCTVKGLEHLGAINKAISYQECLDFDLGVTLLDCYLDIFQYLHPYLYEKIINTKCFTTSMAKDLKVVCKNFYKGFQNPSSFEKIIATTSPTVFKKMIREDSFNINSAKKISQIIEIPKQALDFISQTGMATLLEPFKQINAIDGNTLLIFVNYLKYIKRFSPSKQREHSLYTFTLNCAQLLELGYGINPLLRYLTKQQILTQGSVELPLELSSLLVDYYNMSTDAGISFDKLPQHLEKSHYVMQKNLQIGSSKEFQEIFKKKSLELQHMNLATKEYLFIVPKTVDEMVFEGQILHHCVASYCKRITKDECYIFFLRKAEEPDQPFVSALISKDFKILQAKGLWNEDAPEAIRQVIFRFCATLKSDIRKKVI